MSIQRKLLITGLIVGFIFISGVSGYVFIEKWSFLDAIYMTVITLTTVGFGEVNKLSTHGRIFTMGLLVCGMGVLFYGLSMVTAFIIEGEFKNILGRRKMEKEISKLKNHIILCGVGKTGKHIMLEFVKTKIPFVVIEQNNSRISQMQKLAAFLYLEGDSTTSELLIKAGIERAKGLITTLPVDKDNLFVILTAREINPNLKIISRAIEEESIHKLSKVGADVVISPNAIGGLRMASEMIRPTVVSFLDIMMRDPQHTMRMEEVCVPPNSRLIGQSIKQGAIQEKTGLLVIALKRADGSYLFNPPSSTQINERDVLIVCGKKEQVEKIKEVVGEKS